MADEEDLPEGDNDIYDIDAKPKKKGKQPDTNYYRVYVDARVPVSKAMGPMWRSMRDAALKSYDVIYKSWDECFAYFNNHQVKAIDSPRGTFRRGDGTENVVYSNVNVMLPAVYSKDPDFAVNTTDEADKDFTDVAKQLLNKLFKSKRHLNAKHKIRRAVGLALLTNQGVMKLDYTRKDDSREQANAEMKRLQDELLKAKNQKDIEDVYGKIQALEANMVLFKPSGPDMTVVLPHNLVIDPMAESPDGLDANWMMEKSFIATSFLKARYTGPTTDESDDLAYLFKPTHKAVFDNGVNGERNEALNLVMQALSEPVESAEEDERAQFRTIYYTECWTVWDKTTRRVYLFNADDWSWPLWVWNDPHNLSRFFPYFLIAFGMSTSGVTTVGETSYYLDQQDEINDINRQVARLRRTIFDRFFFNSNKIDANEVEKFVEGLKGDTERVKKALGIKIPEGQSIKDVLFALEPPSIQYEALFNKDPIFNSVNRISNTSDALRGVQFKAGTTEDAVQTYQDAARIAIGTKQEVTEDAVGDMGMALLEMCVQYMSEEDVAGLLGKEAAKNWKQMSVEEFNQTITAEVVSGTIEKPNSTFKKKEALQLAQTVGQFADAAPGSAMIIILKMLENAFTDVNITPEMWDMMAKEITMRTKRGDSTGGGGGEAGAAPPQGGGGGPEEALMNLPPEVKQKVIQMKQSGAPDEEIAQFLQQALAGAGQQGGGQPPAGQPQPQRPQ